MSILTLNINQAKFSPSETMTITFGNMGENHVGMQKIGEERLNGFNPHDMIKYKKIFEDAGLSCELVCLNDYLPTGIIADAAYVLVVRQGTKLLTDIDELEKELYQQKYHVDKMALMRGKVVNKHARWNLCYGEINQAPNYHQGKGRIIAFADSPCVNKIRNNLGKYLGEENSKLVAELNYYYDIAKCGIGMHGDTERKVVIAVRIGASLPIHFQWYTRFNQIGQRCIIPLHSGDMYIMSEKAVGSDWKKSSLYTLRHATGCDKYTV